MKKPTIEERETYLRNQKRHYRQRRKQLAMDKARRHVLIIESRGGNTGTPILTTAQAAPLIREALGNAEYTLGLGDARDL